MSQPKQGLSSLFVEFGGFKDPLCITVLLDWQGKPEAPAFHLSVDNGQGKMTLEERMLQKILFGG